MAFKKTGDLYEKKTNWLGIIAAILAVLVVIGIAAS